MDTKAFLGIEPTGIHTATNGQWSMVVRPGLVTGGNFLWGGCGLAAAVAAIEELSGRTCVWATAQYLSYARTGETMDVDVTLAVVGHQITQARAVCRVGDREILTVNAAVGERPFEYAHSFVKMPDVPPPSALKQRAHRSDVSNTIHEKMEERFVIGRELEELD